MTAPEDNEPPLIMTRAELEALPHYQSTMPTGLWAGKRWRRCLRECGHENCKRRGHCGTAVTWWVAEVTCVIADVAYLKWLEVDLVDARPQDVRDHAG